MDVTYRTADGETGTSWIQFPDGVDDVSFVIRMLKRQGICDVTSVEYEDGRKFEFATASSAAEVSPASIPMPEDMDSENSIY